MTDQMDQIDQKQQEEIQSLQGQDKIHTLLIKFIGISFFMMMLIIFVLFHIVLTQKIYVENYPCQEQTK